MKLNCIYTTLSLYKYVDVMHIHVGSIFMYILYNSQKKKPKTKTQKTKLYTYTGLTKQ